MEFLNPILENWQFISPDRFVNGAFALLLALIVGFLTGPRGYSCAPAFWRLIDASFGTLAGRLDNLGRPAADLLFRGFLIAALAILFCGAGGVWLKETLPALPQSRLIEILIISLCLSTGAVIHHGMRLHQVMKGAEISKGTYLALARTSRFDLSNRDDATLARTGAEIIFRLFDKACVAPLIWYAIGGLPLLFIYSALAALSWKVGYDGAYKNIGAMFVALEKLLGFIPTTFAASLLAVTSLVIPRSHGGAAIKAMTAPEKYPYEQGGLALSVPASSICIALGGPVTFLDGRSAKRSWAGPNSASAKLQADHLKVVLYTGFIGYIYMLSALFGASLWAL